MDAFLHLEENVPRNLTENPAGRDVTVQTGIVTRYKAVARLLQQNFLWVI
jgi:hypothetical protein